MSSSNCCFLTCIQVSQEAGQVVWYPHLWEFSTVYSLVYLETQSPGHQHQGLSCRQDNNLWRHSAKILGLFVKKLLRISRQHTQFIKPSVNRLGEGQLQFVWVRSQEAGSDCQTCRCIEWILCQLSLSFLVGEWSEAWEYSLNVTSSSPEVIFSGWKATLVLPRI